MTDFYIGYLQATDQIKELKEEVERLQEQLRLCREELDRCKQQAGGWRYDDAGGQTRESLP